MNNLLHFEVAEGGLSPTHWQASTFPEPFRSKISVVHDGIDTQSLAPNPGISLTLNNDIQLTASDEVFTLVNRNLEPYRGYHIFMRALPEILRRRPQARVLIVGGDDVSYGARSDTGKTWKDVVAGGATATVVETADVVTLIGSVAMSAADYAAFASANFQLS